jgi:hypothetical protein
MSEVDISITVDPVVSCTSTSGLLPLIPSQTISRTTLKSVLIPITLLHNKAGSAFANAPVSDIHPTSMTELARI